MPTPPPPLLEARSVTRRFGAFMALDQVDFQVTAGEIHALLGENGAGKSTLMNVLSGLLRPTSGELRCDGAPTRFASPADAARRGIGMVHQHFLLVPSLSVAENLLLGAPADRGGPLSYPLGAVRDEASALAQRLGWTIPWDAPAGGLPVGTQQRIEILKALRGRTRVLIFDEPTAVLTPTETPELFQTIRQLAADGAGVVFISHKLDEVLALSRRITVLRRGRVVLKTPTADTDARRLAEAMVGTESEAAVMLQTRRDDTGVAADRPVGAAPRLVVEGLGVRAGARAQLEGIDFAVAPGEIFGIAGVDGNGQAELAEVLSGLRRPDTGQVRVEGERVAGAERPADPNALRRAGVGIIPADRHRRGLALPLTLTENLALGVHDTPAFRLGPLLRWPRLRERAHEKIRRFDIRTTGPEARAADLSGGNQQKVVIARALDGAPRVVLAVNPTRGLDVGAIAFVHDALRQAQRAGAAIVLISTELEEVLSLSDRVGVLFDGRLQRIVAPDTPREELGRLMGGAA